MTKYTGLLSGDLNVSNKIGNEISLLRRRVDILTEEINSLRMSHNHLKSYVKNPPIKKSWWEIWK